MNKESKLKIEVNPNFWINVSKIGDNFINDPHFMEAEVLAVNDSNDFLVGYLSMGAKGFTCVGEGEILEKVTYYIPVSTLVKSLYLFKETEKKEKESDSHKNTKHGKQKD